MVCSHCGRAFEPDEPVGDMAGICGACMDELPAVPPGGAAADLITLAARKGHLDEAAARAALGDREATLRLLLEHGILKESTARELLGKNAQTHCGLCGRPYRLEGPERTCTPCGVRLPLQVAAPGAPPPLPIDVLGAARDPRNVYGRYVRLGRLGRGGFAEVYLAWDRTLGRHVALKILDPRGPAEVARFRREVQLACSLDHPNIAAIYEFGEAHGQGFWAMQLVDGASPQPGDVPLRRAVEIVRDAARAVHYAHGRGVLHLYLMPGHLRIDRGGHVYVLHFGFPKPQGDEVVGIPAYMAPEQARGEPLDARADVYALGAILCHLVTGRAPFLGKTAAELLAAVQKGEPIFPRRINPAVPRDLDAIIQKAMARDPSKRYPSVGELADELDRHLRRGARRPWLWWIGAAAILLLAIFLVLRYSQARSELASGEAAAGAGHPEQALQRFERSVELWPTARARERADRMRRELDRERRLAQFYASVLLDPTDLWAEIDGAGFAARPMPSPERKRELLAEVERLLRESRLKLGVEPPTGDEALAWARLMLGEGTPEDLDREAERQQGSPVRAALPLVLRARWNLKRYFDRFEPPGGSVGHLQDEGDSPVWGESEQMRTWREAAERDLADAAAQLHADERWARWMENVRRGVGKLAAGTRARTAGRAGTAMGAYRQAGERFREAARKERVWPETARMEALAWMMAREFDRAAEALSRGLEADPDWVALQRLRTHAAVLRGSWDEGQGRDGVEAYRWAIEEAGTAIRRNPNDALAFYDRANAHLALGEALAARHEDPREEYLRAIEDYTSAIPLEPDFVEAYLARARAYLAQARALRDGLEDAAAAYRRAIEDFTAAILWSPSLAEAYRGRGNAHLALAKELAAWGHDPREEFRRAIADFTVAISFDPDLLSAYRARARARRNLADELDARVEDPRREYLLAIEDYTAAISRDRKHAPSYVGRGNAHWGHGNALAARGYDPRPAYGRAIRDYNNAVSLKPDLVEARQGLGNVHAGLGDWAVSSGEDPSTEYRRALDEYSAVIERDADYLDAYSGRGIVHLKMREYERAITEFDAVLVRNPAYWRAHYNRGLALRAMGRDGEALAAFEAADRIVGDRDPAARRMIDNARRRAQEANPER